VGCIGLLLALTGRSLAQEQPADAVLAAYLDVQKVAPPDKPYTRYLWLSDADAKLKWSTALAVAGHVNFLSTRRRIIPPVLVMTDGTHRLPATIDPAEWGKVNLLRLRTTDYGWDPATWEKLGDPALEPLFPVPTLGP